MPNRTRVLVVDDDALVRKTMARILTSEGYEVSSHSQAEGLMEVLLERRPEIVLLDLDLGRARGELTMAAALQACGERLRPRPRIIVVSGVPEGELERRAGIVRADGVVSKSTPLSEVVAACRRCQAVAP